MVGPGRPGPGVRSPAEARPMVVTPLRPPPTKRCTQCGIEKPLDAFHKRTRSPDGYQAHCRDCGRAALDAADARARARQRGVLVTREEIEDAVAAQAEAVVDVLFDCAL